MVARSRLAERLRSAAEHTKTQVLDLVWPGSSPPLAHIRRAELISARVRVISLVMVPVMALWIAVDAAFLPAILLGPLAVGRLVVALGFISLAAFVQHHRSMRRAQAGVVALFAIPTLFYFYASGVLPDAGTGSEAGALLITYELLPFVIVGAVAIFPLTVVESVIVVLPVITGKVLGTIGLAAGDAWGEEAAFAWLLIVMSGVAAAGAASQLHFMLALLQRASRDPITGTLTRAVGEELLALHVSQSRRTEQPLSLVFVDLDGFKSVNDRFGHEAGDAVLRQSADTIRGKVRDGDAVVRWGGDEFMILLPGASLAAGAVVVARLHEKGLAQRPDGGVQHASFGIAEMIEDDARDWQHLVRIADERVYAKKIERRRRRMGAA